MARPPKYPWDLIFHSVVYRWTKGQHFHGCPRALQCTMTKAANARGCWVMSRIHGDDIFFAWVKR